jgi:hypothetical protein
MRGVGSPLRIGNWKLNQFPAEETARKTLQFYVAKIRALTETVDKR